MDTDHNEHILRTDEMNSVPRERPSRSTNAGLRRDSKDKILNSARKLFIAQGYEAATVEQIAKEAGLTKGTVYFYFDSKADVLSKLLDQSEARTVAPVEDAVQAAGDSATNQLVALLHAQSVIGQRNADSMLLLMLMSVEVHGREGPLRDRLEAIFERMLTIIVRIIAAGKTQHWITSELPTREIAAVIFAVNQGCFLEWHRQKDKLDGPDFVRVLRTTVLHGLLLDSPPTDSQKESTADEATDLKEVGQ